MAYVRSTRIDPRDLMKNTAVGIKLPFNAGGVFWSTFSTNEQLRYNLTNLILTGKGERVENPNFGTLLKTYLFDNITTQSIESIKESIIEAVNTFIPEIDVIDVKINKNLALGDNVIVVEIKYVILISNQIDSIIVKYN